MGTTILLLCLVYILAIAYTANYKKHPNINKRIFLVLAIGGIVACLIHIALLFNAKDMGKEDFLITILAYLAFVGVNFTSYGVLLQKLNSDKRKKVAEHEEPSHAPSGDESIKSFESDIAIKAFDSNILKQYIDNDFQMLDKNKRKALKWGIAEIKILSEEDQYTFIKCAVCVMIGMELPIKVTPIAKVEGLTQEKVGEVCSIFRPFLKERKPQDDIKFVSTLFPNYFSGSGNIKKDSISKKLINPANFIVTHAKLFPDQEVEQAKGRQKKHKGKE